MENISAFERITQQKKEDSFSLGRGWITPGNRRQGSERTGGSRFRQSEG